MGEVNLFHNLSTLGSRVNIQAVPEVVELMKKVTSSGIGLH